MMPRRRMGSDLAEVCRAELATESLDDKQLDIMVGRGSLGTRSTYSPRIRNDTALRVVLLHESRVVEEGFDRMLVIMAGDFYRH